MSDLRWAVLSNGVVEKRYHFLSEVLTEQGIHNTLEILNCQDDSLEEQLNKVLTGYDTVFIGPSLGIKIFQILESNTFFSNQIGTIEFFQKENNKLWGRNLLHEALLRLLSVNKVSIDSGSTAIIVGAGSAARSAAHFAINLGFKTIHFSNRSEVNAQKIINDFNKKYFQINFNFVPYDQLNLLPGKSSLLINCTPYIQENYILPELFYLNYLRSEGVVIDLTLDSILTPLKLEAAEAHAITLMGYQVAAAFDTLWIERYLNKTVTLSQYTKGLKKILEKRSVKK